MSISRTRMKSRPGLQTVARLAMLGAVVVIAGCASQSKTVVLIAPDEYSGKLLAKSRGPCDAAGPKILILSPYPDPPNPPSDRKPSLKVPFDLDVKFEPRDGAKILPGTFKVFYQMWIGETDISDRLRKDGRAQVTAEGISAPSVAVPAGNYRLRLEVSDDRMRIACKELEFSVVK